MDGSGPGNDVESHIRLNKETLMNSLWKLNVVDIEVTLMHVCQMVSKMLFCFFTYHLDLIKDLDTVPNEHGLNRLV